MAQNVVINSVTYSNVPKVQIPKSGGGTAEFVDTSDATLSSGAKMAYGVTAYANGTKYTGSATENDSEDITVNGATVTVPAGIYAEAASASVGFGSVTAPSTITGTSATVTPGTNAITLSKTISVTPSLTAPGYIASATAGNSSVSLTASVTTKGATTYTPTTSDQTIASGTYLTGAQTISGDANLVGSNIKSGVSIFGVSGSLTSATVSQDGTTKVLSIS